MLLGYYTIKKETDITYTINQIKNRFACEFFISGVPKNINEHEKIVKLYSKNKIVDFVKIEGPSEIIDKIYFLNNKKKSV